MALCTLPSILTTFALILVLPTAGARPRLLTNGSLARGELNAKSYHGGTLYEVLQKKFEQGTAVRAPEIDGWYAGRCFFSDSPMQPVASLLIVGRSRPALDAGPEFSRSAMKSALPLIDTEVHADAFDNLSNETFLASFSNNPFFPRVRS